MHRSPKLGRWPRLLTKRQGSILLPLPITREALACTMFPLGGMTKAEVREHALRLGLATATKPESQDICFLPKGDHARFVAEHSEADASGDHIVDIYGNVLGHHNDGYYRYTIGQRRGLGVAIGRLCHLCNRDPTTRASGRCRALGLTPRIWVGCPSDELVSLSHQGRTTLCSDPTSWSFYLFNSR